MIGGRSADDCPRVWHADANQIGAMAPTSSIDAQRVRITKAYGSSALVAERFKRSSHHGHW